MRKLLNACAIVVSLTLCLGALGCSAPESGNAACSDDAPAESARTVFDAVDDRPVIATSISSDDGGGLGSMTHSAMGVVRSIDREREIATIAVIDGAEFVMGKVVTVDFSKHNGPMYEFDDVQEGSTVEFDFLYDGTEPDGVLGGRQIVVV